MSGPVGDAKGWGRRSHANWLASFAALFIVLAAPTWTIANWITLEHYDGSLRATAQAAFRLGLPGLLAKHAPIPTLQTTVGYLAWVSAQAFLYSHLGGPASKGQLTPAGNLLSYTTNGLLAWVVTHATFAAGTMAGFLDPAIIAKHWEGLLVVVNAYGFLLALFAQLKAYVAPSHPEDRKFSGSIFFDYFCGIELNPRFGDNFDFKLFYNGRPGIIAWSLIDLSWMAYQYQTFGYITKSMLLLNFFHLVYVLDFFYNEDWYVRTIDITHEHFGFYLAWGDTTFLPTLYTLQAQYLGRYPVHLTTFEAAVILAIGLSGYYVFRSVNHQKDLVRSTKGKVDIWGQPAEYISCEYKTTDGETHQSLLLTSGWWEFSRHANYLADLMLSFAMCATCGMTHLLPWTYFFYMAILLYHRIHRDEKRLAMKYGKYWQLYTSKVPYKLMPGLW